MGKDNKGLIPPELYTLVNDLERIKETKGKPKLHLAHPQILIDITATREFGAKKYPDPESWKQVPVIEYFDAYLRHTMAMMSDGIASINKESGLPHYMHAAFNLSCICALCKKDEG